MESTVNTLYVISDSTLDLVLMAIRDLALMRLLMLFIACDVKVLS